MIFPRGLVDRYKQECNFVYYPPNGFCVSFCKFLLSFVGETIHCPFHVFFNLSKESSPQQSLQNFAVSMDFSILVHGIFFS